jgi:hypothetical protein
MLKKIFLASVPVAKKPTKVTKQGLFRGGSNNFGAVFHSIDELLQIK